MNMALCVHFVHGYVVWQHRNARPCLTASNFNRVLPTRSGGGAYSSALQLVGTVDSISCTNELNAKSGVAQSAQPKQSVETCKGRPYSVCLVRPERFCPYCYVSSDRQSVPLSQ